MRFPGAEGVRDRRSYDDEKAQVLQALSAVMARTIEPPGTNVVPMHPRIKPVPA
jgi:hypothetical protein